MTLYRLVTKGVPPRVVEHLRDPEIRDGRLVEGFFGGGLCGAEEVHCLVVERRSDPVRDAILSLQSARADLEAAKRGSTVEQWSRLDRAVDAVDEALGQAERARRREG